MEVRESLAAVLGLRLRVLARFSTLESEEDSVSSEMALGDWFRFAVVARVMGAK